MHKDRTPTPLAWAPRWPGVYPLALVTTAVFAHGCASTSHLHDDLAKIEGMLAGVVKKTETNKAMLEQVSSKQEALDDALAKLTRKSWKRTTPDPNAVYRVRIDNAPMRGAKNAKVTLIFWGDFQCPFTAEVNAQISALMKEYPNVLRVVFKHNPQDFHRFAQEAAAAAEAAKLQGRFWRVYDVLFDKQVRIGIDTIDAFAYAARLDIKRYRRDSANPSVLSTIRADQSEAERLGARATPAIFVNGRYLGGVQDLVTLRAVVEQQLAAADALIQNGTPLESVYEEITRSGRERL